MTPWYIDPTITDAQESDSYVGEYGTGKLRNSWADITQGADGGYFQRADTTFAGKVSITVGGSASAAVLLGMYGSGAKPRINAAGSDSCISIAAGQHYVTVQDFELYGPDSTSTRRCLRAGSNSSNVSNYVTLRRCLLHDPVSDGTNDCNGVSLFGSNAVIEDNWIRQIPTDGIWLQGLNATIRRNTIERVATDGRNAGDCIQIFSDGTLGASNFQVTDNYLDHSDRPVKQVFIHQGTGSTGGLFARNYCRMAPYDGVVLTTCAFVQSDGATIRSNYLEGGYYSVFGEGPNLRIVGNVMRVPQRGLTINTGITGIKFWHNLVMDAVLYGAHMNVDSALNEFKNNIFLRCGTGIGKHGNAVEDFNDYFGCTTDQSNVAGTPAWGSNKFTVDPQLDARYMPTNAALRAAGTYLGGKDLYGKEFRPESVTIGAVQWQPARSVTTRRAAVWR